MSGPPPPPPPTGPPPPGPPPPPTGKFSNRIPTTLDSLNTALNSLNKTNTLVSDGNKGMLYFEKKSDTGFVGLINQGATCYMNSFLQTLYFTPEFLQLIFSWQYQPKEASTDEEKAREENRRKRSIPLQLQILFSKLKLSSRSKVDTKALTTSFGWDGEEAHIQQDIQELRLVLFEALSNTLKNNLQHSRSIYDLFNGSLDAYVQCLQCGQRNSREETFADIPLVIGGVETLDESLQLFLQPEELSGENQYFCNSCDAKVDALKGVCFSSLPPILTFQLNRFTYDYDTFERIKLHDYFKFPYQLNMNKYSDKSLNYNLYSVIIHTGNAMGGHYYSYINSPHDKHWYAFDDGSVKRISEKEVEETFGSKAGAKQFKGTAYMLVYRLDSGSCDFQIPEFIRTEIEKENAEFEEERRQYEIRRDTIHIQVVLSNSFDKSHLISIYKKKTIKEATETIFEQLKSHLPENTTLENVRLRNFNKFTNTAAQSFTGKEDLTLEDHKLFSGLHLLLETRSSASEPFPDDDVAGDLISITLRRYIPSTDSFNEPIEITIPEKSNFNDLVAAVGKAFNLPTGRVRLLHLEPITMFVKELHSDADIEICDCLALYVEAIDESDYLKGVIPASSLAAKLDKENNTIEIKYNRINERLSDQSVLVDQRSALLVLKEEISKNICIPINDFKLCVNALTKKEYKNLNISLRDSKLFDGSAVHICLGKALNDGEFFVRFFRYSMNTNDNNREDLNEFAYLNSLVINENWTVSQIKEKLISSGADYKNVDGTDREISDHLLAFLSDDKPLRWREKLGKRAGRVILPNQTIIDNMKTALQDTTEILIQQSNDDVNTKFNDISQDNENTLFIQLRQWFPSEWQLSPKKIELAISRETNGGELKSLITSIYGIPVHNLQIAKSPLKLYQVSQEEFGIATLNWEVPDAHTLATSPWYLKDGECILFKDTREPNLKVVDQVSSKALQSGRYEASVKIRTDFDD